MNKKSKKKTRYIAPRIRSKRITFIVDTFGSVIGFGPYRDAPRRGDRNR
jgi:hypothetical protein